MGKKVIDVAKWNLITDYKAVKSAGVDSAIVKVINQSNLADGRFTTHVRGFRDAKIPVMDGYTYTYANTSDKAKKSATAFVKLATDYGVPGMILDIEDQVMKNLGPGIVDIIKIYEDYAKEAGLGFKIYTGFSFYHSYIKKYMPQIGNIPFWIARYPYSKNFHMDDPIPNSKGLLPSGIDIDGWQYTSKCIIPGINGYTDLSVWYDDASLIVPSKEEKVVMPVDKNPYTEPTAIVTTGSVGNDANWVLWYLWRFGLLLDSNGKPDVTKINGMISAIDTAHIKKAQSILGLTGRNVDGKVGPITRALFKKVC